jgi:succinate-semialdehyde dehydrogenase/glutarate-semialdehyde dehydrogenase
MAKSINPATGEIFSEHASHSPDQIDNIINLVADSQLEWRNRPIIERAKLVGNLEECLLKNKEKLAQICSQEMGKLLGEAIAEVEKCAIACSYYANNSEKFLKDEIIATEGKKSFVTFKPLGVVLAIMPWNFPYWQVMRFAAPALCAGNGAVLKHASNVSGCALALEKVFRDAGFPENIFRSIIVPSSDMENVINHPQIQGVTLTGSTSAGRMVASTAGNALKKTVLELGGCDAYLILKDADLPMAAKKLVKGRMLNAGQSCISPKRLIVDESVYDKFIKLVESELDKYSSQLAPMARVDLREELQKQVDESIKQGARCSMGGKIPKGVGAFYPPTLLVDVKPGMAAFDEEMFGPVVCVIKAKDEDHAIEMANQSSFGLGGGIFSQNTERALMIASEKIHTGGVFINDFLKSDPRLPFGGIKESGYGRELSHLGIKEFVNAKTIFMN